MKSLCFSILLVCSCWISTRAQEFLSLDSAISRALAHNYDVRIANLSTQIAGTNNTLGNAGLLPLIGATSNVSEGIANTRLVRSEGTVTSANAANTFNTNSGLTASFTVFAAGRAFIIKKQLGKRVEYADAVLKTQVQSTVSGVIQAYAAVVNDQRQIVAIDTAIALAKARMDISKAKYDIGTSAKVDYLQARVDYNTAKTQRLAQDATHAASLANLNEFMGENAEAVYTVEDSLQVNTRLTPADSSLLISRSPLLESQRINAEISHLDTRIARTYYYPNLGANLGYGYNLTTSDASLTSSNRSLGPTGGLGLTIPIFQAGNVRRLVKVASLTSLSAELQVNRQERAISRQYRTAWAAYNTAIETYNLQAENRGYARENLDIQEARFKVGVATSIELREAENSYIATLASYYAAQFNAKVAETKVLEIEARLVEE